MLSLVQMYVKMAASMIYIAAFGFSLLHVRVLNFSVELGQKLVYCRNILLGFSLGDREDYGSGVNDDEEVLSLTMEHMVSGPFEVVPEQDSVEPMGSLRGCSVKTNMIQNAVQKSKFALYKSQTDVLSIIFKPDCARCYSRFGTVLH